MANLKITASIVLLLTAFAVIKAQDDDQPIKINTYLLNIPVIASDRDGGNISGLTKENFTITQDGVIQEIAFFAGEEAPMNVVILIDNSGSTRPFISDIQSAAKNFVKIFRPEDRGLIVTFDSAIDSASEFTSEQKVLRKAIDKIGSYGSGSSDMQDAIYKLVTKDFANIKGRKAIIVLTDGFVGGFISNEKLLSVLAQSDVLVYPIIFKWGDFRNEISLKWKLPNGQVVSNEEFRVRILQSIKLFGTVTGGRLFSSNDFKKSFQAIADELKKQYVIGFYPQNVEDGKPHQITVEVKPENIVIRTKRRIRLKVSATENK